MALIASHSRGGASNRRDTGRQPWTVANTARAAGSGELRLHFGAAHRAGPGAVAG